MRVFRHPASHGDDLLAPAVAQGEGQDHLGVLGAVAPQFLQRVAHAGRQPVQLADGVQPDPVVHDLGPLALQVVAQQVHQPAHLVRRALPVLRGEGVQRERRQAQLARGAGHLAHGVGAPPVTFQAREPALLRPASVPVHDDADVAGQRAPGDLGAQMGELQLGDQLSSVERSVRLYTTVHPTASTRLVVVRALR